MNWQNIIVFIVVAAAFAWLVNYIVNLFKKRNCDKCSEQCGTIDIDHIEKQVKRSAEYNKKGL